MTIDLSRHLRPGDRYAPVERYYPPPEFEELADIAQGLGFALMVIGAVVTNIAILRGDSSVMMTSYAPMPAGKWKISGSLKHSVV